MKKTLLLASLVGALAVTGAAAADPGGGAVVDNYSQCTPSPFAIVCVDVKAVTNVTTTPSGNRSYTTNGVIERTMTFPSIGCTYSYSEPIQSHTLLRAGELQAESLRIVSTTQLDCGGHLPICTTTLHRHEANGELQFGRWEAVCTTP
jgi:hypothetical protein